MLTKKIAAIFLTVFMLFSLAGISASAATTTQDGLEVTLTTDKTEYTKNEQITATLTVKNTNSEAVSDVTLETVIPTGFKVADNASSIKNVGTLNGNAEEQLTVKLVQDDGTAIKSPKTGVISGFYVCVALMMTSGIAVGVMVISKKKMSKSILSLFLCVGIIGTIAFGTSINANAESTQSSTVSVSEKVNFNNGDLTINGKVTYISSLNETAIIEQYFSENSEKIVSVIDVNQSETVPTESEVVTLLKERGFSEYPITYDYAQNGDYVGETNVVDSSNSKHPMYTSYYLSKNNEAWAILVINGDVFANPISFNLESSLDVQLMVSESKQLTSYDNTGNRFYVTVPKASALIVKPVTRIDAETLDNLTVEELSK